MVLRVPVQAFHVRVSRRAVEIEIVSFDILAVIAFAMGAWQRLEKTRHRARTARRSRLPLRFYLDPSFASFDEAQLLRRAP